MEPITTTAIITLVSYLGGKAFDKAFDTAAGEFTKESINWLKSVFFKDNGKPKEVLESFQEKPESPARMNAAKAAIESELEDNPESVKHLMSVVKAIEARSGNTTTVTNSKYVSTASINAGGSVIIGQNNTQS